MANKDLPKSKRIFYIDAIRAIAILLVILCHIANEYPLVNTSLITAIPFFTKDVSRIGVPLFFMISGALLLGRDYPSLKSFIEKRFTRIAYPFIFWIMIYIILCFALNIDAHYLLPILQGEAFTWYIYALVGIYLLIPIINPFINKYGMEGVKYFLILWIITILLNNFGFTLDSIHYNNFTATFAHIVELFSFNYFGGYIGYLLLGYYISNKEFKLSKTNLVYIGFILLIVFLIVNFYITMVRSNCMAYLYFTVILESVGVYLILKNSSIINNIKFNSIIGKITVLISKNSYGMYFSHSIVIGVLFVIFSIAKTSKIYLPIMFILTVIISFIINYILSKIPILNKFSG